MIPGGMSDLAIRSDGPYLTHEPLCIELYGKPDYRIASCAVCTLIARVREEMQPACVCKFGRGYRAAISDALEALKASGHRSFGIYEECSCPPEIVEQDGHMFDAGDYMACAESFLWWGCNACCSDDGLHDELCAATHDHGEGKPWCFAVSAIEDLVDRIDVPIVDVKEGDDA